MKHKALTHRLAVAVVVVTGLATAGCEPRPRDPKPPSDPGRNVPKPITAVAWPAWAGVSAAPLAHR